MLISGGLLKEPIAIIDSNVPTNKKKKLSREIESVWNKKESGTKDEKARKLKEAWEKTNRLKVPEGDTAPKPIDPESPLLKEHGKIDFARENRELGISGAVSGHDKRDAAIIQHKMIENARKIYPHLFNKQVENKEEKK